MSVRREKRRNPKTGAIREFWMVHVKLKHPDGKIDDVRKVSPIQTRRGAEQYEHKLRESLLNGTYSREEVKEEEKPQIPTVAEFTEEFLKTYVDVNNKPSERKTKRIILEQHINKRLGKLPLDLVGPAIEPFKATLLSEVKLGRKRVNNILAVLSKMLRFAEERGVIERAPKVRLLKLPPTDHDFFTFDEYELLLGAAQAEADWFTAILCAGDAGMRAGEIIALEWRDVDFNSGNLTVRRSSWEGIVGTPKGGRARVVPMTERLKKALEEHRHRRSRVIFTHVVFSHDDGSPWTADQMKRPLYRVCKRAGLRPVGWHVLRHSYCSHLAMRGAAPAAIQALAGHESTTTTQRYMHLAPIMLRETVRLLDRRPTSAPAAQEQPESNRTKAASPEPSNPK